MNHGHHGANHPVKDLETGKVEITSMNHGFTVDSQTLPDGVIETHVSLFDGSNCGIRMTDRPSSRCNTTPRRARDRKTVSTCSNASRPPSASAQAPTPEPQRLALTNCG
jgi:hypothetical protein